MRGIPFSARMVQAIRNTQYDRYPPFPIDLAGAYKGHTRRAHDIIKYRIGHVFCVNEPLVIDRSVVIDGKHGVDYEADRAPVMLPDGRRLTWGWEKDRLPSIFMPNVAARDWIQIIKVNRSRLGDMGVMDLVYEGLLIRHTEMNERYPDGWGANEEEAEYRKLWASLWEEINGQGSHDPKLPVIVYHFKRIDPAHPGHFRSKILDCRFGVK